MTFVFQSRTSMSYFYCLLSFFAIARLQNFTMGLNCSSLAGSSPTTSTSILNQATPLVILIPTPTISTPTPTMTTYENGFLPSAEVSSLPVSSWMSSAVLLLLLIFTHTLPLLLSSRGSKNWESVLRYFLKLSIIHGIVWSLTGLVCLIHAAVNYYDPTFPLGKHFLTTQIK